MDNDKGYIEFLKSESHKDQVDTWYKSHSIGYEKMLLYRDFIISLLDLLETTYLGKDVMVGEEDTKNHFLWCINEIVSNFEEEKIYFRRDGFYVEYLWAFFRETFYLNDNEDKLKRIRTYLYNLFIFDYNKTKTDLEMLTEFYTILNQNLKK